MGLLPTFSGRKAHHETLKFFFVFSVNNSGTTAISQYIQSQTGWYLPGFGNYEGQKAPSVETIMRDGPWDAAKRFDWSFIRSEWTRFAGSRCFIEASPPNVVRIEDISKTFAEDATGIFSIASPYQQVASSIRNYFTPETYSVEELSWRWLEKAAWVVAGREKFPDFLWFPYWEFVANPQRLNAWIGIPEISDYRLAGKSNTEVTQVRDMMPETALFLKPAELEMISNIICSRPDILSALELKILGYDEIVAHAERLKVDLSQVEARRSRWEQL